MKTRWEYIVVALHLRSPLINIQIELNKIGENGWELVFVVESEGIFIFKREVKK